VIAPVFHAYFYIASRSFGYFISHLCRSFRRYDYDYDAICACMHWWCNAICAYVPLSFSHSIHSSVHAYIYPSIPSSNPPIYLFIHYQSTHTFIHSLQATISDIRSQEVRSLIQISGTVVRTGGIRMLEVIEMMIEMIRIMIIMMMIIIIIHLSIYPFIHPSIPCLFIITFPLPYIIWFREYVLMDWSDGVFCLIRRNDHLNYALATTISIGAEGVPVSEPSMQVM
jgi:hypothetical protein